MKVKECLRCADEYELTGTTDRYCPPCRPVMKKENDKRFYEKRKLAEDKGCHNCGDSREPGKHYCEICRIKMRQGSWRISNDKRRSGNRTKVGTDDFFVYPEVLNRIALAAVENCPKDYDCDHPLPIEGKERMPCILSGFCPHYKMRGEIGRTA